jgi:hypothetical protein
MTRHAAVIVSSLLLIATGCDKSSVGSKQAGTRLDLDRDNPRPFIEFYFGPYTARGRSTVESGLISERTEGFFLDLDIMQAEHAWVSELREPASDGTLTWDELSPFLSQHYYEVIDAPSSLADLLSRTGGNNLDWMEVEVNGVMTNATRHVILPESAVRDGLENFHPNGERLLYPIGTTIVADHVLADTVAETTAMRKRLDGYWDYFVFDDAGHLASATATLPKNLTAPTQCAGCHLGKRLYEPEKSFPGSALPGPEGPRAVHVGDQHRNPAAVTFLNEHRKRSDGILGLYGTIYLAELLASREAGTISQDDAALLDKLGI